MFWNIWWGSLGLAWLQIKMVVSFDSLSLTKKPMEPKIHLRLFQPCFLHFPMNKTCSLPSFFCACISHLFWCCLSSLMWQCSFFIWFNATAASEGWVSVLLVPLFLSVELHFSWFWKGIMHFVSCFRKTKRLFCKGLSPMRASSLVIHIRLFSVSLLYNQQMFLFSVEFNTLSSLPSFVIFGFFLLLVITFGPTCLINVVGESGCEGSMSNVQLSWRVGISNCKCGC